MSTGMFMDGPGTGKVLLSGASGMLGSAIAEALRRRGTSVLRLVRREPQGPDELGWNPAAGKLTLGWLDGQGPQDRVTAVVHLSGANVASGRWTVKYKHEMTESRVATTRLLAQQLAQLRKPPQVLVSASAVGFYGDCGDEIVDESAPVGKGFLSELCAAWEAAAEPARDAGIRVAHLRFGVVVGPHGGLLARLAPLFRLGLGGRLGSGRQWMSWVSQADAVGSALFALGDAKLAGPVNVAAPDPATNASFTRELSRALHRPALLPAPAFALRLAFGEMADEALLASTRAIPKLLLDSGFHFAHPTLPEALAAAVGR